MRLIIPTLVLLLITSAATTTQASTPSQLGTDCGIHFLEPRQTLVAALTKLDERDRLGAIVRAESMPGPADRHYVAAIDRIWSRIIAEWKRPKEYEQGIWNALAIQIAQEMKADELRVVLADYVYQRLAVEPNWINNASGWSAFWLRLRKRNPQWSNTLDVQLVVLNLGVERMSRDDIDRTLGINPGLYEGIRQIIEDAVIARLPEPLQARVKKRLDELESAE